MNGTGFGFPSYPQRPSVKPQQVGQALQQMNQPAAYGMSPMTAGAAQPPAATGGMDQLMANSFGLGGAQDAGMSPAAPMRGFEPDATSVGASRQAQDPEPDPAMKLAVEEAMHRQASGGASAGQQGSGSPNNPQQLARMGLSPLEIKLLWMSGGARY